MQNVLFSSNDAYLIDFDLTREEGTFYPNCYNGKLDERHIEAAYRRCKKHDRYSLHYLLKSKSSTFIPNIKSKWVESILDMKKPLEEIADELQSSIKDYYWKSYKDVRQSSF